MTIIYEASKVVQLTLLVETLVSKKLFYIYVTIERKMYLSVCALSDGAVCRAIVRYDLASIYLL